MYLLYRNTIRIYILLTDHFFSLKNRSIFSINFEIACKMLPHSFSWVVLQINLGFLKVSCSVLISSRFYYSSLNILYIIILKSVSDNSNIQFWDLEIMLPSISICLWYLNFLVHFVNFFLPWIHNFWIFNYGISV